MAPRPPIYRIDYEFQTDDDIKAHVGRGTDIYIRASSGREALASAIAFWKQRHKNLPEYFRKVGCVTIHLFDPNPLEPDGSLRGTGIMTKYQWKISTGCGPGVVLGAEWTDDPVGDPYNEET